VKVITPTDCPEPTDNQGWCFPDTEHGIISALEAGATHLWANTVLFTSHPLQTSNALAKYETSVRVIGQPPRLVDKYDDKAWLNAMVREQTDYPMPSAWTISSDQDFDSFVSSFKVTFPIVAKPVRGRGSHGVKLCRDATILKHHLTQLFTESPLVLLEQYLSGQEGTVTVLPPSDDNPDYTPLPLVVRFNHADGIAPYNGVVAVTQNSRAIPEYEIEENHAYKKAAAQCTQVAKLLGCTAPIRIDVRQFTDDRLSPFALFDINMKPVSQAVSYSNIPKQSS
jgi:D-alanine-D-alanine ligase-like ATP-grasp enzyme